MYVFYLILTLIVLSVTAITAWSRSRDPIHPAFLLGLFLGGMYLIQPLWLMVSDYEELAYFLSESNLDFITGVNLVGVTAICLGTVGPRNAIQLEKPLGLTRDNPPLRIVGIGLGSVAVIGYLYGVFQVGGFSAAYGKGYGGGWSNIGYVREAYWLSLPAIALIAISSRQLTSKDYAFLAIFAMPLLFHGLLGGRRGPTAACFLTLYLSRAVTLGKRPTLIQLGFVLACLGLVMLLIVANRHSIGLSQDVSLEHGIDSYATSAGSSNEFVYGGGIVLSSWQQNIHYYGGRYVAVLFIRPIPRQIFPNKYEFAADFLGIPNLEEEGSNMGTGNLDFFSAVGWEPAVGAAPGLIADLWLEFGLAYFIALFIIGRCYWFAWHRMMLGNEFWSICYIVMAALSVYLITQTLEAMLFRFLLAVGFITLTWLLIQGGWPNFQWRLHKHSVRW